MKKLIADLKAATCGERALMLLYIIWFGVPAILIIAGLGAAIFGGY